jgi:hypothetical protein
MRQSVQRDPPGSTAAGTSLEDPATVLPESRGSPEELGVARTTDSYGRGDRSIRRAAGWRRRSEQYLAWPVPGRAAVAECPFVRSLRPARARTRPRLPTRAARYLRAERARPDGQAFAVCSCAEGVRRRNGMDRSGRSWLLRPCFAGGPPRRVYVVKRTLFGKLYPRFRQPRLGPHVVRDESLFFGGRPTTAGGVWRRNHGTNTCTHYDTHPSACRQTGYARGGEVARTVRRAIRSRPCPLRLRLLRTRRVWRRIPDPSRRR